MKRYTLTAHATSMMAERDIRPEWVSQALSTPALAISNPSDTQTKSAFMPILEQGGRILRVVYNATVDPVRIVTVYFDRSMRGKL
jgi:hypothetical protein